MAIETDPARVPAAATASPSTAAWLAPILAALDPEQRAAALLPDGPAQIIAPAGSGKTTTLIARMGVLLARDVPPAAICVVTFNRDAALDLARRIEARLVPHVAGASRIEVRTLHALARQVLVDAGDRRTLLGDRLPMLRAARRRVADRDPGAPLPEASELDGHLSAWKIEGRAPPPHAAPALEAYAALAAARGTIDFDDLVVEAARRLESEPALRRRWQSRFVHVLVDEFQDVDAAQHRLVRLLAAPEDNLVVIGDDDQTIYAWRLADVRRILGFAQHYPAARRVMLATNYRCPRLVVEASARVIEHNAERFVKPIRPPQGSVLEPDEIVAWDASRPDWIDALASLATRETDARRTLGILARTRTELLPVQAALVRAGLPHRSSTPAIVESPAITALMDLVRDSDARDHAFHVLRTARAARGWRRGSATGDAVPDEEHDAMDALLGWSAAFPTIQAFAAAFDAARTRIMSLRTDDAVVELGTVHTSKGREWETVVLIGFEADRMPNRRSLLDTDDPARALEEERRLAYVALTRATRQLILAFDAARPSPFLAEMGLAPP